MHHLRMPHLIVATFAFILSPTAALACCHSAKPSVSVPHVHTPKPTVPRPDTSGAINSATRGAIDAATRGVYGAPPVAGRGGSKQPKDPNDFGLLDPRTVKAIDDALNAPPDPNAQARKNARDAVTAAQNGYNNAEDAYHAANREIDRAWAGRNGGGFPPLTPAELKAISDAGGTDAFIRGLKANLQDNIIPAMDQASENIKTKRAEAEAINAWQDAY
jgi:hypothetical protein